MKSLGITPWRSAADQFAMDSKVEISVKVDHCTPNYPEAEMIAGKAAIVVLGHETSSI